MGFDLKQIDEEAKKICLGNWYHRISLDDGTETPAPAANIISKFRNIEPFVERIKGATVLDVGCNAGGLCFEFANKGADVLGIEASTTYLKQLQYVKDRRQVEGSVEYLEGSVYEALSLNRKFDYVLFIGLIYHLRYPQLALDILAEKCFDRIFINTPVVYESKDAAIMESRIPDGVTGVRFNEEPKYNFWFPSIRALQNMMYIAGFSELKIIWNKQNKFVSSASHVNNSSYFDTGQVLLTGRMRAGFSADAASKLSRKLRR